jgi:hypothetical protein
MILHETEKEKLYMNYDGPFIIQIISTFAKFLLENTVATERISKKLYRVFIELAQNVALYSFERVALINGTFIGKGKVYILENVNTFKCITINRIQKEHAAILTRNCTEINATPAEALRAKRRGLYKLANFQDTGAHIGLIMICTYSANPIEFEIIEKEEGEIYFKIAATINKNEILRLNEL